MRALKILLPLGIAVHLGVTLWRTDVDSVASVLEIAPGGLVLAVALAFVPWLTNGLRLWNWLRWEGERRPFRDCVRIVVASEVGAAVTPTSIGSASVKTAMLTARGIPLPRALSFTGVGSLEDSLFFLVAVPPLFVLSGAGDDGLLGRVIGLVAPAFDTPHRGLLVGAAGVLVVLTLSRTRRGRSVLGLIGNATREWRTLLVRACTAHPVAWSTNLLLAALQWGARYSVLTALLYGIGLEIDPVRAFVLQWMCFTIMALVPTPGAMGGAELVFLALFAGIVPGDVLALVTSVWRLLTFYLLNLVGLGLLVAGGGLQRDVVAASGCTRS